MLTSLKKLHDALLQERYSEYHDPNKQRADKNQAERDRDNPQLSKEALEKIYELEYKLFKMALYKRKH